jgi:hypothetical protein
MAHDGFVSVRTILGCIGVGEAFEGVAVAGLDGIEPDLFDRKTKTGMIKAKPNPPYEYKVLSSDSVDGRELEYVWHNTSGIDDTTCDYPEGDNSSISTN